MTRNAMKARGAPCLRSVDRQRALQLEARFADVFGGADKVPAELLTPAAHFRRIPRTGQVSTLVIVESDDGMADLIKARPS